MRPRRMCCSWAGPASEVHPHPTPIRPNPVADLPPPLPPGVWASVFGCRACFAQSPSSASRGALVELAPTAYPKEIDRITCLAKFVDYPVLVRVWRFGLRMRPCLRARCGGRLFAATPLKPRLQLGCPTSNLAMLPTPTQADIRRCHSLAGVRRQLGKVARLDAGKPRIEVPAALGDLGRVRPKIAYILPTGRGRQEVRQNRDLVRCRT